MALTQEQSQELRSAIEERRRELMAELNKDVNRAREQQYGELAGSAPDTGDESVADLISDLDLAQLAQVEAARGRFAEGSYGECVQCGSDIDFRRLRANPSALRCVDCQALYEKTHAQPGSPTI